MEAGVMLLVESIEKILFGINMGSGAAIDLGPIPESQEAICR